MGTHIKTGQEILTSIFFPEHYSDSEPRTKEKWVSLDWIIKEIKEKKEDIDWTVKQNNPRAVLDWVLSLLE